MITIHESPSVETLEDIYPFYDVEALEPEQRSALQRATDEALRDLVVPEWERRGYTVIWHSSEHPIFYSDSEADPDVEPPGYGDGEYQDLREIQEQVWDAAWRALADEAIWAEVIGFGS